jgi:hypothetical protein
LAKTNLEWWSRREPQWGTPMWLSALLVAAALALLGLRFINRDLVPYILDEPNFQNAAELHARARTWPSMSPLTGNLGVAYGPGPIWFYTAVHRIAGPRPERSILAATLFLSLAELLLAAALARALRGGWLLFATLTALLAASPFLFFWSRLAWEVFSGYIAISVALLASDRSVGVARGAVLGVFLGLALTSHPMTLPFALATVAVLGWEVVRRRARAAGLIALLSGVVFVNLPYLWALHAARRVAVPPGPGLSARILGVPARLPGELLESARVFTTNGVDYFFDAAWPAFRAWLGSFASLLALGPLLTVALSILAITGLVLASRRGPLGAQRVARIGLLAWLGLALLLSGLQLVVQPHYQLAASWLIPTGVGALVMAFLPQHPKVARGLLACIWAFAVSEATFNQAWMQWIREHGGTAGIHYSVPLAAQRAVLKAACSSDLSQVAIANRTYLFAESLLNVAQTEAACDHKRIGVCPLNCPALDAGWRVVSLRYAAPPGGKLAPLVR